MTIPTPNDPRDWEPHPHLKRRRGEGFAEYCERLAVAQEKLRSLHRSAAWRDYLSRLDVAERIAKGDEPDFRNG